VSALVAALAMTAGAAAVIVAGEVDAVAAVTCSSTVWAEGVTYTAGQQVTYNGHLYQALVTHTAYPGAGWNPAATPSLWRDLGACTGGGTPTTTPPTTRPTTTSPTTTPTTTTPTTTPPGGSTCAVKSRPGGKVLQG
jgi:hypothetical protein